MSHSTLAAPATTRTQRNTAAVLVAAIVAAVGINALVAWAAYGLGAHHDFGPLAIQEYGAGSVVGILAGWLGWRLLLPRLGRQRLLTRVVPAVGLALFVPDLLLLALRFIPHTTATGVFALMVMHIVVIAVAVPAYLAASEA